MTAPDASPDPRITLAVVSNGTTDVPADWARALSDENTVGLTALDPDLDLLYRRPTFENAREEQAAGQRVLRFRASGRVRSSIIASVILFSVLAAIVVLSVREIGEPGFDGYAIATSLFYTLLFAWLGVRTLSLALIRSNIRYIADPSAPHGVRLEAVLVFDRFFGPQTVRFSFHPTAILLANRHYPGEENIPISHPRHQVQQWTDGAVLAVGANSEFVVIGCHRNLDLAREVLRQSEICTELTACGVPVLEAPPHLYLDMPPRPPLPDDKREWKPQRSDIDIPPLTPEELRTLFDSLDQPNPKPCDHTFTETIDVLQANDMPVEPTLEWLERNGAHCDCEVIFNTAAEWGEWAQWEPADEE